MSRSSLSIHTSGLSLLNTSHGSFGKSVVSGWRSSALGTSSGRLTYWALLSTLIVFSNDHSPASRYLLIVRKFFSSDKGTFFHALCFCFISWLLLAYVPILELSMVLSAWLGQCRTIICRCSLQQVTLRMHFVRCRSLCRFWWHFWNSILLTLHICEVF